MFWIVVYALLLVAAAADVNSTSLTDKVLFGYQGWFDTPSAGRGWVHWTRGTTPSADSCTFDLWPDVSEFTPAALDSNTELHDKNGDPMPLYAGSLVQDTHFAWMKEYGIDGVVIQRFISELADPSLKATRDLILTNSLKAAESNGRVVSLMYDISGASSVDWDDIILDDWTYLTQNLSVTSSSSYLRNNDKPVLFVWGIGFNDREATAEDSLALVNTLKETSYFVGGVPTHWRTGDGDSLPGFDDVYAAMDSVTPWLVGRFSTTEEFDTLLNEVIIPDSIFTAERGQAYAPNVWPGFSWTNLQKTNNPDDPEAWTALNQIPRQSGSFWKYQFDSFAGTFESGTSRFERPAAQLPNPPQFIYGAMFDEFDESTAMAKAAANADALPVEGTFLHLSIDGEDLPGDYYLELAGNSTDMLRNKNVGKGTSTSAEGIIPVSSHIKHQSSIDFKSRAMEMSKLQRDRKLNKLGSMAQA